MNVKKRMNGRYHHFRQWTYVAAVIAALGSADASFALPAPDEWQEPTPVPIEWGPDDGKPCVTSDGLMLSYERGTPHNVWTAQWNDVNQEWNRRTNAHDDPLGQSWTSASCISPDKQWLFYIGSSGLQGDIYRSTWNASENKWDPGESITNINTSGYEDDPYFDGNRLYFAAGPTSDYWDIYYSEYDDGNDTFGPPVPVDAVNTEGREAEVCIADNGHTLLWSSDRSAGYGGFDIWMTTWDSERGIWDANNITNLGPIINNSYNQANPSYSTRDGGLYFIDDGAEQTFVVSVPEPATLLLLALGGLALCQRRRK